MAEEQRDEQELGEDLLLRLRSLLRNKGARLSVGVLDLHGLFVSARAKLNIAEPAGMAFHQLELVAFRLGRAVSGRWSLPGPLTRALLARGLGEKLSEEEQDALEEWE